MSGAQRGWAESQKTGGREGRDQCCPPAFSESHPYLSPFPIPHSSAAPNGAQAGFDADIHLVGNSSALSDERIQDIKESISYLRISERVRTLDLLTSKNKMIIELVWWHRLSPPVLPAVCVCFLLPRRLLALCVLLLPLLPLTPCCFTARSSKSFRIWLRNRSSKLARSS